MDYLFIFVFVLIITIIALSKWSLEQREKIKELKRSVSILNKEHNLISKENIELREFIKMQDLFIGELRKNDRDFKVGDTIEFTIIETGCKYSRDIIYIFEGGEYGLEKGFCILTLSGYNYNL